MHVCDGKRIPQLLSAEVAPVLEIPDPVVARELLDLGPPRPVTHEEEVDARIILQDPHRLANRLEVVDDAGIPRVHHDELLAQSQLLDQRVRVTRDRYDLIL